MSDIDEPVLLLLKAVDMLPEGERVQVLGYLLSRGLAAAPMAPGLVSVGSSLQPPGFLAARSRPGEQQQMVPVRFPVEQHQRLRDWCGEHGFSMAVVVRGLVDQFLDQQGLDQQGSDLPA